jgi:hypothetical protein
MSEIYHVMYMDTPVADVIRENDGLVSMIQKFVPDSPKQPFWGNTDEMSRQALTDRFYVFLKDRCYEDNRADLQNILKQAGLSLNNPYEWVKIAHGVTYEDFFWVKINDENLHWKDVNIRESLNMADYRETDDDYIIDL